MVKLNERAKGPSAKRTDRLSDREYLSNETDHSPDREYI
jgi:hypothetical protein